MASSKEYLEFILDQLSALDDISYRNTSFTIAEKLSAASTMTAFS